ncbi:MAG: serine hydrolase [Tessaracoccus sp.]|uniref:serine hydrolase domain-containing protein n=1 Tax=Tessaracoccus sp. TaxID=1971211 RepID=UPI001EBD190A|nr:serine hydrolase [Tessaracoccus sp.]MBK7822784.1 serine hydrolase [Tessaracoccus sp.]
MARRRRLWGRILLAVALLLVVAGVAVYWYVRPLLLTGTGYAAHNACAVLNVAGREDPEADLPPNPLVPYLRTAVNDDGSISTTVLGILAKQTAWYTEGFGCTIAAERPSLPASAAPITSSNPIAEATDPASVPPELAAALDAAFADGLGTRAVVVVKEGALIAERYADGFTKDTPQLGWSMAKSVTNLLVGRMADQRAIQLTDNDLREDWARDERRDISVDDLLRMQSGLRWDETYDLGTAITKMLYLDGDMAASAAAQPLDHAPGTFQQYSSGSTNIACEALLLKARDSANLPRTQLLAPLGISSAVWEPDASGVPVCSSYLWATPRDWAAIGQFALDDGVVDGRRLLPEGWMAEATTNTTAGTREDENYGSGWWLNRNVDGSLAFPGLPADTYWASGHDGQRLFVIPSQGLVIARLGFSPDLGGDALAAHAVAISSAL